MPVSRPAPHFLPTSRTMLPARPAAVARPDHYLDYRPDHYPNHYPGH